ncbi:hypothetical protein VTG60DRAFT_1199 [Thermothelomyces hinnuleus]
MLLPKQAGVNLRALSRATRCLSTTAARPWATPTSQYPSSEQRSGSGSGTPVDDIDLVFDYPTEGQTSHQKQPLESQGLDYHSALPRRPKAENLAGKMGKEMGATDSNVKYRYIGLGAVGLGGLYYMMMRRTNSKSERNMTKLGDSAAQKSADIKMERMLGRAAPSERYIHSEVLKRYPGINVALHGHPEELTAYSISNVPLRPVIHMAPFLGKEVPVFNITEHYLPNDTRDFLVRNQRLGSALAALFDSPTPCGIGSSVQSHHGDQDAADRGSASRRGTTLGSSRRLSDDHGEDYGVCCNDRNDVGNDHSGYSDDGAENNKGDCECGHDIAANGRDNDIHCAYPSHNIVLMQSHGFTAVATDIRIATYEGIYAVVNARVQAEALKIQHAYHANQAPDGNVWAVYLNEQQIRDSWETEINILEKPWEMWVREVKVNPLFAIATAIDAMFSGRSVLADRSCKTNGQ